MERWRLGVNGPIIAVVFPGSLVSRRLFEILPKTSIGEAEIDRRRADLPMRIKYVTY